MIVVEIVGHTKFIKEVENFIECHIVTVIYVTLLEIENIMSQNWWSEKRELNTFSNSQ
jgi:hypothetical protein